MKQAFLSYARLDQARAARLLRDLRKDGAIGLWFDRENLLPGMRWRPAIRKAIRESDFFIALLSANAVAKRGYRNSELHQAIEVMSEFPDDQIFLIPARLDECTMPSDALDELTYADLFPSWKDGIGRLRKSLGLKSAAGKAGVDTPAAIVRTIRGAARNHQATHHYQVSLVDLDAKIPKLGRIASGLSKIQPLFGLSAAHLPTPRPARKTIDREKQLYIDGIPDSFYRRMAPIRMDFAICLTEGFIAFARGKKIVPNYLVSPSPADERVRFVSHALLKVYSREAGISLDAAIAFLVTGELVSYFFDIDYHDETRNCPMDFDDELSDLVGALRAGRFCADCQRRMKKNPALRAAVTAMIGWGR